MSRITEALKKANTGIAPSLPVSTATDALGAVLDQLVKEAPEKAPAAPVRVTTHIARTEPTSAAVPTSAPDVSTKLVIEEFAETVSRSVPDTQSVPNLSLPDAPGISDQFSKVATALYNGQMANGTKVVLVSSAVKGEGKTFTALNLALTLSGSFRRRVLLIDADMRKPSVHRHLNLSDESGLAEALRADADRKVTLARVSPNLSVLVAGKPLADPMSTLSSARMQRIIQDAAAQFDWVIIDTPPAASTPDANLISRWADGVLLVIRANTTPSAAVQNAIDALGKDRILGVILNHWAAEGDESPSHYGAKYSTEEPSSGTSNGVTSFGLTALSALGPVASGGA
jgi:capsular exopolysaccharide synthesis family protein